MILLMAPSEKDSGGTQKIGDLVGQFVMPGALNRILTPCSVSQDRYQQYVGWNLLPVVLTRYLVCFSSRYIGTSIY